MANITWFDRSKVSFLRQQSDSQITITQKPGMAQRGVQFMF